MACAIPTIPTVGFDDVVMMLVSLIKKFECTIKYVGKMIKSG